MAKSDIEIKVKNENIHRLEGEPDSLFVMKLSKPIPMEQHMRLHAISERMIRDHFPGSDLSLLPAEVDSVRHLNEEDLNKVGYFKKEVD